MPNVTGRPGVRRRPRSLIQPSLKEHIERARRNRDAPHLLDLSARRRLMVGDHGERFDRRAGELLLLDDFPLKHEGEILRGAERPAIIEATQRHASPGIGGLELAQQPIEVDALRHALSSISPRDSGSVAAKSMASSMRRWRR